MYRNISRHIRPQRRLVLLLIFLLTGLSRLTVSSRCFTRSAKFLMLLEGFHVRNVAVCFSGTHDVTEQFSSRAMLLKGERNDKIMKVCIFNI